MKRWKRPLRAHSRTRFVPSLEILEVREMLNATFDGLAATNLLGDLAHLRDDWTASAITLLRDAQSYQPNAPALAQMRGDCNQAWNTLAADCETTWQAFVRFEDAALGAIRQVFGSLLTDVGIRPPDESSAGQTDAGIGFFSATKTTAIAGILDPVLSGSPGSHSPLGAAPLFSPPRRRLHHPRRSCRRLTGRRRRWSSSAPQIWSSARAAR